VFEKGDIEWKDGQDKSIKKHDHFPIIMVNITNSDKKQRESDIQNVAERVDHFMSEFRIIYWIDHHEIEIV